MTERMIAAKKPPTSSLDGTNEASHITDYPKDIVIGGGTLNFTLPALVVLNSRPGGGKSHFARFLIYEVRKYIAHGLAFSKSIFKKGNLDYIPDYGGDPKERAKYQNFRHETYDENALLEFLKIQTGYPEGMAPLGFVIWDDNISDPQMFESPAFVNAVTMFRHYNLFIIICTQYINKLTTVTRECASYVGLCKMETKRSLDAAYESYGQEFDSVKHFKGWLLAQTKNPKDYNI